MYDSPTYLEFLPFYLAKEAKMRHRVYTVYDSKAQVFMNPIYFRADGEALRAFKSSVNAPGHQFNVNAGDYTLFGIGEYDDDCGKVFMYESFVNLGNGAQFKEDV